MRSKLIAFNKIFSRLKDIIIYEHIIYERKVTRLNKRVRTAGDELMPNGRKNMM